MKRKLAAILSADVVGYSRLIELDAKQTIRTLAAHSACFKSEIEMHGGRLVDAPGDNLLAEFASVIDAVQCAIIVQEELARRNAVLAPEQRMQYRIGINVGDIIVEDGRLYGDGINIAARLEGLAEPGGICLSGNAVEQIGRHITAPVEFVGEKALKNISAPVAVWRVRMPHERPSGPVAADVAASSRGVPVRSGLKTPVAIAALVIAIAAALWWRQSSTPVSLDGNAAVRPPPAEATAARGRPAIIVLPFSNLSDAENEAYFSDGLTEDITTDLSKLDGIFVVAANDAFKYKGRAVESAALREELGIRYLIEGSVRKTGDQLRISVRLIDVVDDAHLWSERYDRSFNDILSIQDDIRSKILTALKVKLTPGEQGRFVRARTTSLEAYDFYLRGLDLLRRARTELRREFMHEAIDMFSRAIEIDPTFALAYGRKGMTHWLISIYHWSEDPSASLRAATKLFEQALALDTNYFEVIRFRIFTLIQEGRLDDALPIVTQWIASQPNESAAHRMYAYVLAYRGEFVHALAAMERAAALTPRGVLADHDLWMPGMLYLLMGEQDKAIEILLGATLRAPNYISNHLMLVIALMEAGREYEARAQVREVLRISPDYDADTFRERLTFTDPRITERFISAMRQAGLP